MEFLLKLIRECFYILFSFSQKSGFPETTFVHRSMYLLELTFQSIKLSFIQIHLSTPFFPASNQVCNYEKALKSLTGINKTMEFTLKEIPKLVNGVPSYKKKIKNDTAKYREQISQLLSDSTKLSDRYNSCCVKIEKLYRKFLDKSVFHENRTEFQRTVDEYKTNVVEMFDSGGTHVKTFVEKLDPHAKTLLTLEGTLRANEGGAVNATLESVAKTMDELENLRKEIKKTLGTEKCFKKDAVHKDFEKTIGKVGRFKM